MLSANQASLTSVRIARSDWGGPCVVAIISTLSRMCSGNPSTWRLTCEYAGWATKASVLLRFHNNQHDVHCVSRQGQSPPESHSSNIQAFKPPNLPSDTHPPACARSSPVDCPRERGNAKPGCRDYSYAH